jgi:type I site-specific restriction-modification system R (restriction) subunit
VLANYTTYRSYYEIKKSIEDNPLFDKLKAQKKLRAYVERDQQTIDAKAEIMLEHFIDQVVTPKKLSSTRSVNSFAIISACFSTVSVASNCISGGYPN